MKGQDPCDSDATPPTLAVVSGTQTIYLNSSGQQTIIPANFVNQTGTSDNCTAFSDLKFMFVDGVSEESELSYDCSDLDQTFTINIIAIDIKGNPSALQAVTIEIRDNIGPDLEVSPPQDVYLDNTGNLTIIPIDYVVSVTDNCTPVNNITIRFKDNGIDQTSLSYTCADIGQTKTITVVAIDQKGNRTEKNTSITIKDVSPPIFYILAGSYYVDLDGSGNMTISPDTYVTNQSDNCTAAGKIKFRFFDGSEHIGQTLSCNDVGPKILSILAFDESGNRSATQDVVISVRDNTAPTFDIVLGQVIAVGTNGRITVFPGSFVTNGADNCTAGTDIDYFFFDGADHTSLEYECSDIGPKTVSIVAVDKAGNRSTPKNVTFTIGDQTAPIFDVVAGIQDVFLGEDGNITISPGPFILNPSDNCTAVTDIIFLFVDGTEKANLTYSCVDIGQKTLTIVAYDAANNRSVEKTVAIHIKDNMPPAIDCTSPVIYPNGQYFPTNSATQCTYRGSFTAPSAVDNCTSANQLTKTYVIVNGDYPPIPGSGDIVNVQFPIGTNTVTYTITDQSGNSSTCSFTVEVKDGDPPVITCPTVTYPSGKTYFPTDPDVCVSKRSFNAPVATDNCTPADQLIKTFEIVTVNGAVTGTGDIVDYKFPVGINTVTYTVADAAGNTDVCSFPVVVKDDQAPVAICRDITVTLGILSGERTITVSEINNGSWDNCGITQMSLDIDKFNCTNLGENEVELTVEDDAGNTASCTAKVFVQYDPSLEPQAIFRQQEICSNSNAVLDLTNPGFATVTDWSWTVIVPAGITPNTGLDGTAHGDYTITQLFDNSTDAVDDVTYLVTPKLYGTCALAAIRADVSVNPRPKLVAMSDTSICNNTSTRKIIRTSSSVSKSAEVYYGWTVTNNTNVDGESNSVSEQNISSLLDQELNNRTVISQDIVYTLTPSLHLLGKECKYPGYDKQLKVTIEPTPIIKVLADNDTVCNNTTILFKVDSLNNPAGQWRYTLSTNIPLDDNASPDVSSRVGRQHDSFTQTLHNEATRWHRMRYMFSPQIITKQGHTCFAPSRNDTLVVIRVNPTPLMNVTKFQDSICYKDDGPEIRMTSNNGEVLGTLRYNLWQVDYTGSTAVENVATIGRVDFAGRTATIDQTTLWNKSNTEQTVVYYIYPFIGYGKSLHCSGDSIEQKIHLASELVFDMVESVYPGGRNVKCYNASDGYIEVKNQHGGWSVKGYDYEWSGYTDAGNTPIITNRPAATYGVTVRDKVIGCQTHKEVTLTQPDLLRFMNPSIARPDCNGPTGSIMVHATGGTRNDTLQYEYKCFLTEAPLLYSYTGADSSFTNLKSGKYTVMVVDTNQCLATVEYELPYYSGGDTRYPNWNKSEHNSVVNSDKYNITCHGANDGEMNPIFGSISGYRWTYNDVEIIKKDTIAPGDPLFQYVPKGGDFYVTNLKPGYYDLTLYDERGCRYKTERQWITEPPEVTFNVDIPKYANNYEVKCDGAKDGRIIVSDVAGGYGEPYDYVWSASPDIVPGAAGQTALGAGTYTLTIRNEFLFAGSIPRFCDTTITRTLNEPPELLVDTAILRHKGYEIQCYGEHTGSIKLNVSGGGNGGYSYHWTTTDGSGLVPQVKDQDALSAGTYTVDIGYSGGLCSKTEQYTLHSPSRIRNDSIVSGIKCHGGGNASVQINISGGVPSYSYRWSSPDVTVANPNAKDQSGLAPGTYWLVVTDGNGCPKMETYSLLEPAPVSPNLEAEDMSCIPGNDGYITAIPFGGTPGYTFLWSNGSTAPGITGLLPGTYSVTVTDMNGCTGTANAAIKVPLPLTVTAATTTNFNGYSIDCYGNNTGKIGLTIENGRGPYTYLWSSGAVTDRIDHATFGQYSVTVTDKFNCSGTSSVTLTQPDQLWGQSTTTDITCPGGNNGSIQALVGGGVMPYRYQWSNGSGDSPIAANLVADKYTVRVIDKNNCHFDLQATLKQPPAFKIDFTLTDAFCPETSDGDIRALVSGGTPPYTYLWTGVSGATAIGITDVRAGAYTLEITDAVNCTYTETVELGYASDECLRIPNAFSPNNDGSNDTWEITIGDRNASVRYPLRDLYPEAIVEVYSGNWGMLLYRSQKGYPEPWDGKYRGKYLPMNSYWYIIKLNKNAKPITGNVTIIR